MLKTREHIIFVVLAILMSLSAYRVQVLRAEALTNNSSTPQTINLNSLEGTWEGIDNDKTHGSELIIYDLTDDSFKFTIDAFWLNKVTNCPNVGFMSGQGCAKGGWIELETDDGALKAELSLVKSNIHIEFQGDTSHYGGLNVTFATGYRKK